MKFLLTADATKIFSLPSVIISIQNSELHNRRWKISINTTISIPSHHNTMTEIQHTMCLSDTMVGILTKN